MMFGLIIIGLMLAAVALGVYRQHRYMARNDITDPMHRHLLWRCWWLGMSMPPWISDEHRLATLKMRTPGWIARYDRRQVRRERRRVARADKMEQTLRSAMPKRSLCPDCEHLDHPGRECGMVLFTDIDDTVGIGGRAPSGEIITLATGRCRCGREPRRVV